MKRNYWRINNNIRAPKVRVLEEDGNQVGVMEIEKALAEARQAGLDLVEIAPKAVPPVVQIIDFGKFRYREEKKLKKSKKKNKAGELKEIRFSPFIAEGDFSTRVEKIREFLEEKNKVRLVVKFKGRQMGSKKFGYEVLDKVVDIFKDRIVIDMKPKFLGRHLAMVISPTNKPKEKKVNKDKEIENKNAKTPLR
ncbi:translation initiation factor IF-3 [Candidatus Woesebacteria bacterium]|nr:translation initiation factor IF-3 [Candidatus Woesebacteria bacterium]